MKKHMSSAALALRMTFRPVLAVLVIWSGLQLWSFFRSEAFWTVANYSSPMAFEDILDNHRVFFYGKVSFLMILYMTLVIPKNKACYTLRRLRISEGALTFGWGLVFSGYYLLSWALQLLLTMGMFRIYAQAAGLEALDYFRACYRGRYLHLLMPLGEPWGYVRNTMICLGWGFMGALTGHYSRHGGKPFLLVALVILTALFLPANMASQASDIVFCVIMGILVAVQLWLIREVERNED